MRATAAAASSKPASSPEGPVTPGRSVLGRGKASIALASFVLRPRLDRQAGEAGRLAAANSSVPYWQRRCEVLNRPPEVRLHGIRNVSLWRRARQTWRLDRH